MSTDKIIKASEVSQYAYCSKAWQLQRNGYRIKIPSEIKKEMDEKIENIKKLSLPKEQKREKIRNVKTEFEERLDSSLKIEKGSELHKELGKTILNIQKREAKINTIKIITIILLILSAIVYFVLGVLL